MKRLITDILDFFDEEGEFSPKENLRIYKLDDKFKKSFCQITNEHDSFVDSSVEIYKEKFAFIMVQNGVVVQIVAPDVEAGNFGDYPIIQKPNYDLSSWSRLGIKKLVNMVNEVQDDEEVSLESFPYKSSITESYD